MLAAFRKHFSAPGLLKILRSCLQKVLDHRLGKVEIALIDALMSGLAVFGLKYPSLLKFDEERQEEVVPQLTVVSNERDWAYLLVGGGCHVWEEAIESLVNPRQSEMEQMIEPHSSHVELIGMRGCTDTEIWNLAEQNGYVLVSKDDDFRQRGFVYGAPPNRQSYF